MPLNPVQIPKSTNAMDVAQNVEHAVNVVIQQLNASASKLSKPLNAQQQPVTNLPFPQNDTDAVNLGYLNKTLNDFNASLQNTLNRRSGGGFKNIARPYHCIFKAALAQNGTAIAGFSFGTSHPPTPVVVAPSNGLLFGALDFGTTGSSTVQDHFPLPEDWVPSSLDCVVCWYAPDGGGDSVTWNVAFVETTNGTSANGNPFFNPAAAVSASVAVGPSIVLSTITNVIVTSNTTNPAFQPGGELFFEFWPTNVSGTAQLIDIRFLVRRSAG